jgi:regulator of sigma E protease
MTNSIFDIISMVLNNAWLYGGTFVFVLSLLVFVHEFGHYIMARWCNVRVEVFSIGFGKEIWGFNDKRQTRWKLSMVPLGGYVKLFGDTDPASAGKTENVTEENGDIRPMSEEERKVAQFSKPVWQRALVVVAGPAINFLFAILILAVLYGIWGQPVTPPVASAVIVDSAAKDAGFLPQDRVTEIDGKPITRFDDIRQNVMIALDTPVTYTVKRGDKTLKLTATARKEIIEDRFGFRHSKGTLGVMGPFYAIPLKSIVTFDGVAYAAADEDALRKAIFAKMGQDVEISLAQADKGKDAATDKAPQKILIHPIVENNPNFLNAQDKDYGVLHISPDAPEEIIKYNPIQAVQKALLETWDITSSTLKAMGQMVTGTRSATELGGIIRIGAVAGDMAQAGFMSLVAFAALLSINLGLINLFPIPMLDGGHLVFYAIEALRGKPVPEKVQEYAFRTGFVLLIGLMLFANINDVLQLIF